MIALLRCSQIWKFRRTIMEQNGWVIAFGVRRKVLPVARTLNTRPGPKLKRSSRAFRYKEQSENPGVTEITEILNRGHSLTIDSGWQEVAQVSLDFVRRFV